MGTEADLMLRLRTSLMFCMVIVLSPAVLCADEAPHARAYLDSLASRLQQINSQMPAITNAADLAAESLAAGKGFGVRGDDGLAHELSNRAGAMMGYDGRRGDAGRAGDVILFVIGLERGGDEPHAQLLRQVDHMQRLKANGSVVIALGSVEKVSTYGLLDAMQTSCNALIDNGVPFNQTRGIDAPLEPVLNTAAAWAFQCELFAALTRLDKVPVVRKSFEIDTRRKRWYRYGSQPFHHDRWLDPIAPGKLGEAYISSLQIVLADIGTASWKNIAHTSRRAADTLNVNGKVWLRAGGRSLPYHVGGQLAHDPDLFTLLTHDGSNPNLPAPGKHDMVIAVGRYETAGSWEWGEPELLRKAGRGVAWVVNGYNTQRFDLKRNERLIDLWGPVGDCVVKIDNYDTRLGPVSSVVAESVTWMIAAEVKGRLSSTHDHPAPLR